MSVQIPMDNARLRLLAALVCREGGHLEISHAEFLAAPDSLLITSTESGNTILRDPNAHEWDGENTDRTTEK